jgi:hypothetical protein
LPYTCVSKKEIDIDEEEDDSEEEEDDDGEAKEAAKEAKEQAAALETMTPMQRKLFDLRMRMNKGRKENQTEAKNEKQREDPGFEKKRKREEWKERSEAKKKAMLARGEDPEKAYLNQTGKIQYDLTWTKHWLITPSLSHITPSLSHTVEHCEVISKKKKKKDKHKASFGWDVFNEDALYKAYKKRLKNLPDQSAAKITKDPSELYPEARKNLADGKQVKTSTVSDARLRDIAGPVLTACNSCHCRMASTVWWKSSKKGETNRSNSAGADRTRTGPTSTTSTSATSISTRRSRVPSTSTLWKSGRTSKEALPCNSCAWQQRLWVACGSGVAVAGQQALRTERERASWLRGRAGRGGLDPGRPPTAFPGAPLRRTWGPPSSTWRAAKKKCLPPSTKNCFFFYELVCWKIKKDLSPSQNSRFFFNGLAWSIVNGYRHT